jgi:predicted alpha/beta superfamily hydrolase
MRWTLLSLLLATPLSAQLTIALTRVPAGTPANATVYVAGSFNRWNPAAEGYRLTPTPQRGYSITLPDSIRGSIEFKFTLGSWETVETTAAGGEVSNRTFVIPATGPASYTGVVERWRDGSPMVRPASASPSVSILAPDFAIPQLGRSRRLWIYLPPGYANSGRRYPVLYMHDGQNLFDAATSLNGEWGVDETLDSLAARADRGVIVVGIDNGGDHRLDEYSPWRNARYGGGEGDAYVEFLVRTLKPYIDEHYRTLVDRENTGIAGSSMGGLISLYAALKYPDVFGKAGVFSPSLWFAPAIYGVVRQAGPPHPGTRIYFVTGALEGSDPTEQIEGQRIMIDSLRAAGYRVGTEMEGHIRSDGRHAEWFWRREFPAAYRWLFDTPRQARAR